LWPQLEGDVSVTKEQMDAISDDLYALIEKHNLQFGILVYRCGLALGQCAEATSTADHAAASMLCDRIGDVACESKAAINAAMKSTLSACNPPGSR
jgi:hypothetical protein